VDDEQPVEAPEHDPVWRTWRETGDLAARNELLLRYSPLVKYVAGRVRAGLPRTSEHHDVVSEGMIGLIDALEKFEPERGLAFPTYAVPRIRGAIFDSVRAADWVPRSVRTRAKEVEEARALLREQLDREPRLDELAEATGLSTTEIRLATEQRSVMGYASPEDLEGLDTADAALEEALDDDGARELLMPAVHALPERDKIVLALYYFEGLTLAEIGRVLDVTESRVSQLRSKATKALREALGA
jgi:RNA polymerase sigma factor for flagellar operon FliA